MTDSLTPLPHDEPPGPSGEITLQTIAMPRDTNPNGDIFGGWLVSQMDLAGSVTAARIARGRVVTVAIDTIVFMRPLKIGALVACHTTLLKIGRSSIQVKVEVWDKREPGNSSMKVTEGVFTFVAIDENGRTRAVPR